MPKVKEMSFVDAQKLLREKDAALASAAQSLAKAKDAKEKETATKALRTAAIDFANHERYARSAKARENSSDLL